MNAKYIFGILLALPFLPIMYLQSKRIRASVPKLPEAKGIQGIASTNSNQTFRLLTLGESTIAGVGVATHDEGFTGALAKTLAKQLDVNVYWKVYAKSGYKAKMVVDEIIPRISEKSVNLIVIGLGANDAFKLNSPKRWRRHIQLLITTLQTKFPNTPIAFTNMPPIKSFPAFTPLIKYTIGSLGELLGDELSDLLQHEKNVFYNAQKITLDDWITRLGITAKPADFFSDGVHPSKLTYQVWGKDFANFLLKTGAVR